MPRADGKRRRLWQMSSDVTSRAADMLSRVYDPPPRPAATAARQGRPGERMSFEPVIASGEVRLGPGGSRYRGIQARTGVNTDPNAQPDARLRELNGEPAANGPREEVYCTKVGATRPDEMYVVGAHMDGHGWGEAARGLVRGGKTRRGRAATLSRSGWRWSSTT